MWHALRAELAYFRPWLLGALGIGLGVVALLSGIFHLLREHVSASAEVARLYGMFLIMAPMIVAFIAQAYRSEERRARLLLAAPLTPRQIAVAAVLLPVLLFAVGVAAAGVVMGLGYLVSGRLDRESLDLVGFVGGMMLAYAQMGLLAQEATAARGQRRPRASAAGWALFAAAVVLLAGMYLALTQEIVTWLHLFLAHLAVAAASMAATVALYVRRTDFTR